MRDSGLQAVLERVWRSERACVSDLERLLLLEGAAATGALFDFADGVRRECVGDGILLRGIVEFSSYCSKSCLYCGLNRYNDKLRRYRLSDEELMDSVRSVVSSGVRTVVLQAGQEDDLDAGWLGAIVERIKSECDVAVTLSVGERSRADYRRWKEAGADRYLLKIETTDRELYESVHPEMSFENRVRCLADLKELGYQVGSGNLVGLKGQTARHLAEDILFFKEQDFDMLGIGLFIPHGDTRLAGEKGGSLEMVLKVLAVTRIVTGNTHLPATTAVGSVGEGDGRIAALRAGANVLMPNYTPAPYRKQYEIYPGKRCVDEKPGCCVGCMEGMAASIGRFIDYSRGDSLKTGQNEMMEAVGN